MRVRFKRDRNWTPPEERRITVAYKQGMELTIKRAWGEQMVKDGDAEEIDAPRRSGDEPGSSPPAKQEVSAAQIKAMDGARSGVAGGPLPKAQR